MLDIARDSRWGRIAESPGEDPYLASILGKAYVEGFQGDLSDPTTMAACAKHYSHVHECVRVQVHVHAHAYVQVQCHECANVHVMRRNWL